MIKRLGNRHSRPKATAVFLCLASVGLILGCGRETPASQAGQSAQNRPPAANATIVSGDVLRTDRTYTLDDLVAAGWRKSKQYTTENVPGAKEVWYGFYNRKDIEVRVYESAAAAASQGTGPAQEAVNRPPASTDYLNPVTRYKAYLIVGNIVMLCDQEVADCVDLVATLKR
ncbi:MAG: hypothetical protein HY678_03595 [Chloroflexi bacterium]|nr:hypothetical protein [Chloroflexota bacterium]